jgi:galactonate dehydratase
LTEIVEVKPIICNGGIRNWTFCKITTDDGIVGWGDGTEWSTPHGVASHINDFGAMIIGEDPTNIEKIWQYCWRSVYVRGKDVSAALAAIETALWDIKGKIYGVPVVQLLGGKIWNKVRLYYDYVDAYGEGFLGGNVWRIGDDSLEGVAKECEKAKKLGFTAVKCHPVGLPPRRKNTTWMGGSLDWPEICRTASLVSIKATVKKIEVIRETVGDEVDICVDVNNRLDLPSSIRLAKALEPYNLLFLEDPICQHEDAAPSYKRLTSSTTTPIGTGENLYTIWEFRSYLELEALDFLLPDVCHTGIIQAKKIAALAEAYHLPLCFHNPNSPLSTIISAHLASSIPNFVALEYYEPGREPPWTDKITKPSISSLVKNGYLELPEKPGWGVELNEEEIMKHPYEETWLSRKWEKPPH